MKKILSILLTLAMVFTLVACSTDGQSKEQTTEKAKEALIDGTLPSSISGVISRDMVEMKSVEDAVAVMWAGIGGQE